MKDLMPKTLPIVLAAAIALAPGGAALAAEGTVTVTYSQGQAVASALELDGVPYRLSDWSASGAAGAEKRSFERTQKATVAAVDFDGDAAARFAATLSVEEDGFAGDIPLAHAEAAVSKSHEDRTDYEQVEQFSNLSQEELDALPDERKVTAGGRELVLKKLSVDAERMPSDPSTALYEGSVTYGIHEGREVAEEYELTAVYSGELSRAGTAGAVTAVYEPEAGAAAKGATASKAAEEAEKARANDSEAAARAERQPADEPQGGGAAAVVAVVALAALAAALAARAVTRRLARGGGADGPDPDGGDGASEEAPGDEGGSWPSEADPGFDEPLPDDACGYLELDAEGPDGAQESPGE